MNELKPCPFCGRGVTLNRNMSNEKHRTISWIQCRNPYCGLSVNMPNWRGIEDEEIIAAWNSRAAEPEARALTLEELKQSHGKPMFIVNLESGDTDYWAIGDTANGKRSRGVTLRSIIPDDFGAYELYGITWVAYDREPKGE